MKTNIFMNPYQQQENKLTYNLLSLIEYLNSRVLMEFLSGEVLQERPVADITTVYGGGESNPDGSITLTCTDGREMELFFENKTYRRGLSVEQLRLHLELCGQEDRLLVITPRKSDLDIIRSMPEKNSIRFFSWSEVASFIKQKISDSIAQQFVAYGRLSGEFEELGEIHRDDIAIYCECQKLNFDGKIKSIFQDLAVDLDLSLFGFTSSEKIYSDAWGRKGVEITYNDRNGSYGQWLFIGYYYDTYDHEIEFKNEVPEIVVFFDVAPDHREALKADLKFRGLVSKLTDEGFESNLNLEISPNEWRLIMYRRSITSFQVINLAEMLNFVKEVFGKLQKCGARNHKYFSEL